MLWQGQLPPERVVLHYDPQCRFQAPAQWSQASRQACLEATRQGRQVKNLPLYHILDWRFESERLHFDLGLTCYEDYLGLS